MTDSKERYPVATLHGFLQEVSVEFRRYRKQATLNVVGAVFLLLLLGRFTLLIYETARYRALMRVPLIFDVAMLMVAFAVVLTSLDVWRRQRKFLSRWGQRFEKLQLIENELLPE